MRVAAAVTLAACALGSGAAAEIRDAAACAPAIAADPDRAREEAARWRQQGGGTPAELCEAAALEAIGALGSAAMILTRLGENPNRALVPAVRATILEDAARLWIEAGQPDPALAILDQLPRLGPDTAARDLLRARAAAAAGDWAASLAALDAVLREDPGAVQARALRAAALRRSGDPAAALAEAEAALAEAPDLPEARFEAGAAAAELGQAEAARAQWLALIAAHPDHALATLARRNLVSLP
jgi:thioredoxin-like negative regulator of GroEL